MKLPTHEDWMNEKFVETVMKAKDIDGAYAAAMDIFSCKLDDILAVFSHAPINVKESTKKRRRGMSGYGKASSGRTVSCCKSTV